MMRLAHQHAAAAEIRRNKEEIRRDPCQRAAQRRAEIPQRGHKKHARKAARRHLHHAGQNREHRKAHALNHKAHNVHQRQQRVSKHVCNHIRLRQLDELRAAAAGDEVLGIFLSDALSGTGQCARLAADLANVDNVVFVNTENVCLGQSLLVRLAVQLRDAGKTITQIAADLEKAKQHLHLVAAVDDLKYLRKGGRLSAAAAVAGGMLGIKPILAVIEGKVALAGKARGLPGVYVALFKKIDEMGGIHPGYTPLLGYTVNHRELQPLLTYLQDNLHLDAPLVRQIGCVIGTHTGPGAFGIAFFDKELALE